jgi:hypothetical protein
MTIAHHEYAGENRFKKDDGQNKRAIMDRGFIALL